MPTADGVEAMPQPSTDPATTQYFIWQCLKCGYVLVSRQPPDGCPDCGAAREDFIPLEED